MATITRAVGSAAVRRIGRPRIAGPNPLVLVGLVPAVCIVGLLLVVVWLSLQPTILERGLTLQHYVDLYFDPFAYTALLNTLGFALVTLVVAVLFGVPVAWLTERTNLPGKPALYTVMTIGIFIPGFFTAMGWLFLFHPRIGVVNQMLMNMFGLTDAPVSILNILGMGWVQGLGLAALVFAMTTASLRAMDASLEEASQTSGATFTTTLRRVTLPLAWPGLLATGLYVLTIAISAFDVPLIIGLSNRIFVFSTYLLVKANPTTGLPEYGVVAAFSTFMLVFALAVSLWYSRVLVHARKYQVIGGKSCKPRVVRLGIWVVPAWTFIGTYILLSKVLPLLLLVWATLLRFFQPPSMEALQSISLDNFTSLPWDAIARGARNTAILMICAPTLALAFSFVLSWIVLRTRSRLRLGFDVIAFLPHAVPHTVFGFGALLVALFLVPRWTSLYGSLLLLLVITALTQLSFATRITNSALIQINRELEEAAYAAGASVVQVFRSVLVPLLRPVLVYAWLWLALLTFRELILATILFSPDSMTLAYVTWSLWSGGSVTQSAAVSLIMMCALLPLVVLYFRVAAGPRAPGAA